MKNEEKVSFLNNSNKAYHLMNLIIRLYFQKEWSYGSSNYEQLTNEIYAAFASFSRDGNVTSINIIINEYVDKHVKNEILQLSKIKINEFIKVNEIIDRLKIKYSNQERTLKDLLLNNNLNREIHY